MIEGGQPQHILHSSFVHFISSSFLAGDIAQMHLPAGMQDLNLSGYGMKTTGKRIRRRVMVEQLSNMFDDIRFCGQPHSLPHSSFYLSSSFLPSPHYSHHLLSRRGYRPVEPSRRHEEREL
jgi:hypothetical protein